MGPVTQHLTEPDFESALNANPGDAATLMAWADSLTEAGHPHAAGMQWLAAHGKRPMMWKSRKWCWFVQHTDNSSTLDLLIARDDENLFRAWFEFYPTPFLAFLAAAEEVTYYLEGTHGYTKP